MIRPPLPTWGAWVLFPALAQLENEGADLVVDLRTVDRTKRFTELVTDLSRDPEADVAGLVAALDEILDPIRTLVPTSARALPPGEIASRCMRVWRRWPEIQARREAAEAARAAAEVEVTP